MPWVRCAGGVQGPGNRFGRAVDLAAEHACDGKITTGSGLIAERPFRCGSNAVGVQRLGGEAFGTGRLRPASPHERIGCVVELARAAEGAHPAQLVQLVGFDVFAQLGGLVDRRVRVVELAERREGAPLR